MLELKDLVFEVPVEDGSSQTKRIIDGLTLTIADGKFTVITGPNGGGKSTLAKLIMGIEQPTSGSIVFNGRDITRASITERAKLGIGYGFQQPARFKGMKVKKLLELAAGKRLPALECNEYLAKVGLCSAAYPTREVDKSLSGGEVKRIEIATMLARIQDGDLRRARGGHRPVELRPSDQTFRDIHETRDDRSIVTISHQERIISLLMTSSACATAGIEEMGPREESFPSSVWSTAAASRYQLAAQPTELHPDRDFHELLKERRQADLSTIDEKLLEQIADLHGMPRGAFNIGKDGQLVERHSSANITIETFTDKQGIEITIAPGTKNETVHIPVIMTKASMTDVVYNDFHIGEDADVTVIAGCGIHNTGDEKTEHDGIHSFWLGKDLHAHATSRSTTAKARARASAS